jgi:hypothetical protein
VLTERLTQNIPDFDRLAQNDTLSTQIVILIVDDFDR